MKVAFDTSVLVAALVQDHPFHARAVPWLHRLVGGEVEGLASSHALAETWATLTRLPLARRITGEEALWLIRRSAGAVRWVPPVLEVYEAALERSAERGVASGAIFDAIHVVTAERAGVEAILTFNERDFVRLLREDGPRIVVPEAP